VQFGCSLAPCEAVHRCFPRFGPMICAALTLGTSARATHIVRLTCPLGDVHWMQLALIFKVAANLQVRFEVVRLR
jgi:hypothetical protein